MRSLAWPFMVFAVRVALVVVVLVSTGFAVVLAVVVCLGFDVTPVTVAVIFGCLSCFVTKNGAAQYNARRSYHGDGDQLLLADFEFIRVEFHVYS
jgi:hypothetical protein